MTKEGNGGEFAHLDLFTGIGGFSLAFESCGFKTIGFVECDPIKCVVLRDWWPAIPILPDVRDTESIRKFCEPYGTIDVITAGVPCQPASTLGKQRGTSDERWMWPATIRLVRVLRPRFFVAENPPAVITLERGRAWNGIVSELVACGHDLQWDVFPAGAFGAGHRRERVILVATDARYSTTPPESERQREEMGRQQFGGELLRGELPSNASRERCSETGRGLPVRETRQNIIRAEPSKNGCVGNVADSTRGQAHERDGRILEQAQRGGKGVNQTSGSCGHVDATDSEGQHVGTGLRESGETKENSRLGWRRLSDASRKELSTHSNSPRLQGHAGDENRNRGGAG